MIDSTKDKQQDFSKIQGRFNTRLLLSGANADEVIKKRILEKKDTAATPLRALYDANSSRLSSLILFQGKPTWSGYKDADEFKDVYPFVSYQFELLQKVFESIREHGMSEGKHLSQNERSLLDAFQTSAKNCADQAAGLLVPFDSFYQTIEQFIDYDIKTVFANAAGRAGLDAFDLRVLRLLFMIKHVKEMPSTIDRLATLMVESINEDKAALKERIYQALLRLEEETLIQKNGEEYDFLTNAEQDVNRQINNSGYNEGEIQRTILEIIFDKVLESNKFRYEGRYDFGLNRFVDTESKGSFSQDSITLRICTQFSRKKSPADFQAESVRDNAIIVDLSEGNFVDELIRANKIATFRRNNTATMSASFTEIMSKKSAEMSDRIKRAEDLIRVALRTAPIYLAGSQLDIKQKDGKDRLLDALKEMVKRDYFKLGLVSFYYPDQKSVFSALTDNNQSLFDLSTDPNKGAYEEILDKMRDDKRLMRKTTVKSLLDFFSQKPYGWRDLDVLGMIAVLWRNDALQILIHENVVDEKNASFKNDFARKSGVDAMVVRLKDVIDEELLYKVKRIMNDVFAENYPLQESALRDGVLGFFGRKRDFLASLKQQYGSDYAGAKVAAEIAQDVNAILRSGDALTVFNEIISRRDSLEAHAETLEQLEAFYKSGSHQQRNYQDAVEIIDWYNENALLQDLSRLQPVIDAMAEITSMEMPFRRMNELAELVFKAGELKDAIQEDKFAHTVRRLETDRAAVQKEMAEALQAELTEEQKRRIREKAEEISAQYTSWFGNLTKTTQNMDAYITASGSSVGNFRRFIAQVLIENGGGSVRSKRVSIIDLVPVANKKVTSPADVDKVLDVIRNRLLAELKENDELNLS